jgi:hypothetical protein
MSCGHGFVPFFSVGCGSPSRAGRVVTSQRLRSFSKSFNLLERHRRGLGHFVREPYLSGRCEERPFAIGGFRNL